MFAERMEEKLNDDDDEDEYSVYSADTDDDDESNIVTLADITKLIIITMKLILLVYVLLLLGNNYFLQNVESRSQSFSVKVYHQRTNTTSRVIAENLINYKNIYWVGDVCIGTPPQCFKMLFDTGSSDLWIPSTKCYATDCANFVSRFDESKSSTFKHLPNREMFSIAYMDGTRVSGLMGVDSVSINGFTIHHQSFAQITFAKMPSNLANDGIFGLGFYSLSNGNMTPVVFNLWHQRLIDQPIVSFWLDPNPEHSRGGEIFFGGVNSQLFEDEIIYANVTKQQIQRWEIQLNG
ncbi:unnamed protein product [Rotaria sordida]|uniref:Peptidase A1 domain-containing protein n=1 Tax=Rotaria sordida TaxID=392033 RepID=A0A814II72_9BILA|nr:unnamed protein product [Rotaria sordida]